jgi:hypothetical protein
MRYSVSIRFEVDSEEYHSVKDDPKHIYKLAKAMVEGEADFPPMEDISISIANKTMTSSESKK